MPDQNPMLGMPPGVDPIDYAKIMRQSQVAELLQQAALSPVGVQQPQGSNRGFYQAARVSPLSGISRLAEAMMAKRGMDTSNTNQAQMYAQGLRAFAPGGGGAPAPAPAAQGADGGYSGGAGASDAGQPGSAQPAGQAPINPMNPTGQDPRAMMRLYMQSPKDYLEAVKGTPEWQTALLATGGDRSAAQALLTAKMHKDAMVELRTGNTMFDPLTNKAILAPNPSEGVTFRGDPLSGKGVEAIPIKNSDEIAAGRAGAIEASKQANTPHEVPSTTGAPTFITPHLAAPPGAPAPGAPQTPPVPQVPKSYFPAAPTGLQTTSGKEQQSAGGKQGVEYAHDLAADSSGALEVRRSLAEMRNLAKSQDPSASNTMRMKIGQFAIASGMSAERVARWTGIDAGVLEAAKKQTSGLAVASIHQMTNRGTNFDLETFMENNPNLLQTPGGFQRVVDYMDGKSKSIIEKQRDFQKFKKTGGENGGPLPPEDWMPAHAAHWNELQEKEIESGKYTSRTPTEATKTIGGTTYVKRNGQWETQ